MAVVANSSKTGKNVVENFILFVNPVEFIAMNHWLVPDKINERAVNMDLLILCAYKCESLNYLRKQKYMTWNVFVVVILLRYRT